jgi:hypothetical protein
MWRPRGRRPPNRAERRSRRRQAILDLLAALEAERPPKSATPETQALLLGRIGPGRLVSLAMEGGLAGLVAAREYDPAGPRALTNDAAPVSDDDARAFASICRQAADSSVTDEQVVGELRALAAHRRREDAHRPVEPIELVGPAARQARAARFARPARRPPRRAARRTRPAVRRRHRATARAPDDPPPAALAPPVYRFRPDRSEAA